MSRACALCFNSGTHVDDSGLFNLLAVTTERVVREPGYRGQQIALIARINLWQVEKIDHHLTSKVSRVQTMLVEPATLS
jgi:hypothetical protein